MNHRRSSFFTAAVIIACLSMPQGLRAFAIDPEDSAVTKQNIEVVHIDADGIVNAVHEFAKERQLVIGVEDAGLVPSAKIHLDLTSTTVADVLNAIIAYAPGYAWRLDSNGAIHIYYPTQDQDKLANVKVRSFQAYDYTRLKVWDMVARLPEVQNWLRQNNCNLGELMQGTEFRNDNKKIWLNGSGKTVGEILDEAASQSGLYSWSIVQHNVSGRCTVGIRLW